MGELVEAHGSNAPLDALVVDDSSAMRAILGRILSALGFHVVEARDGLDALDRLREHHPAFAFVDWNMPRMDGLEFVKAVRADRARDRLKLVVVSTEVERSRLEIALSAGADAYVFKPFTKEVVVEKLRLLGFAR